MVLVRGEITKRHNEWSSELSAMVKRKRPTKDTRTELQHLARQMEVSNQSWHQLCTFVSHTKVTGQASEYLAQLERDFGAAESLASQHSWAKFGGSVRHLVLCELMRSALEARDGRKD